jgi:S-methylmethionine-dependent homocysteine/selenocysteine methylase
MRCALELGRRRHHVSRSNDCTDTQVIMSASTTPLPQLDGRLFLTDGGIETDLIFNDGMALPHFAAFDLLVTGRGVAALRAYYRRYLGIATAHGVGFILESPTWRASADWGRKLGYSQAALARANAKAIALMLELRRERQSKTTPIVVSGCVGPRGDGYDPGTVMSADEAQDYHAQQIGVFADAGADMVTAITMTNANEALGVARAAEAAGMHVAISFTLETDGRLPTGQGLRQAIEEVDAASGNAPAYYMINCAHPSHFETTLATDAAWVRRIRGLRANASRRSHAELNEAPDLDEGNPAELGAEYRALLRRHPHINVLGGCCGTDRRHVEAICGACKEAA